MVVMQRTAELPGMSPAPGELEIVRRFVNTLDIESGTDELASPGALLGWLRESRPPGRARIGRPAGRSPKPTCGARWRSGKPCAAC